MATKEQVIVEAIAHEKGIKELNEKLEQLEKYAELGAKGKLNPDLRMNFEKELKAVGQLAKAFNVDLPHAFEQATKSAKAMSTAGAGAMKSFSDDVSKALDKNIGAIANMDKAFKKFKSDSQSRAVTNLIDNREVEKSIDLVNKMRSTFRTGSIEFGEVNNRMTRSMRTEIQGVGQEWQSMARKAQFAYQQALRSTATVKYAPSQATTRTSAERYATLNKTFDFRGTTREAFAELARLNEEKRELSKKVEIKVKADTEQATLALERVSEAAEKATRPRTERITETTSAPKRNVLGILENAHGITGTGVSNVSAAGNMLFGAAAGTIGGAVSNLATSTINGVKGLIQKQLDETGELQYSMMGTGTQVAATEGVPASVAEQKWLMNYQRKSVQSNVGLSHSMAFLLENNNSVNSEKLLKEIDNIVSVTGGDMVGAARAVSQIQGKGALRGPEINQLVDANVSVITKTMKDNLQKDALSGKLGADLKAAAEGGQSVFDLKREDPKKYGTIEVKYLNDALEELGGASGKFKDGVETASKTLTGVIQNTKESIWQAGARAMGYYVDETTGLGQFSKGSVLDVAVTNLGKVQDAVNNLLFDKDGNLKAGVAEFSKQLGSGLQKIIDYGVKLDWKGMFGKAKEAFEELITEGKRLAKEFDLGGSAGAFKHYFDVMKPVIEIFADVVSKNAGIITNLYLWGSLAGKITGPLLGMGDAFFKVAGGLGKITSINKKHKEDTDKYNKAQKVGSIAEDTEQTVAEATGIGGAKKKVESGIGGVKSGASKLGSVMGTAGKFIGGAEVAIAGAAGDIFLMGRALKDMHKNMKGISWDSLSNDLLKMGGATLAIETFVATTGMIGASNPFILLGEVVGTIMTGLADLNISMMDDTFKKLKRIQKNLTSMAGFQITGDISTGIANTKNGISQLHAAVVGTSGGDSLSKLATEVYNDFVTGPTPLSKAVDGVNEGIKQLKDFGTAVSNLVSTAGSIKVDAIKGAMDTIRDSMKQLASAMGADETDIFNASQNVNTNLNSTKNVGATTEGLYNFKPQPQGPQNGSKTGSKQFAGTLLTSLKAAADNAKKLYDDGIKPYSDALLNLANAKEGIDKNTAGAAAVFSSLSKSLTDLNNAIMNADSVQQFDTNSAANMLAANLDALGTSMSDIVKQTYNLGKALLDVQETFNQSGKDLSHALIRGMLSALKTGRINARITEMMQAVKTDDVTSTGARIGKALSDGIISSLAIGSIQAQLNTLTAPNLAAKVTYSNEFIGPLPTGAKRATKALGGSVGTDSVPALLSSGEYVVRRSASDFWGNSLLSRINNLDLNGVYHSLAAKIGSGRGSGFGGFGNTNSYDNSRRTTNVNVINRNHGSMGRSEMIRLTGGL